VPDGSNWKATMLIEFPDVHERKRELARLIGVEDRLFVEVEGHPRVYAIADEDLDRRMSEKRVYPSILLNKSGTRREELLLKPEILQKTWILRKLLYSMDEIEAMEFILDKMKSTKNNIDFFDMMRRGG
jgi:hypothetical protein